MRYDSGMKNQIEKRGGFRIGAGRKPIIAGEDTTVIQVTLPASAAEKLKSIGPTMAAAARTLVLSGLYGKSMKS